MNYSGFLDEIGGSAIRNSRQTSGNDSMSSFATVDSQDSHTSWSSHYVTPGPNTFDGGRGYRSYGTSIGEDGLVPCYESTTSNSFVPVSSLQERHRAGNEEVGNGPGFGVQASGSSSSRENGRFGSSNVGNYRYPYSSRQPGVSSGELGSSRSGNSSASGITPGGVQSIVSSGETMAGGSSSSSRSFDSQCQSSRIGAGILRAGSDPVSGVAADMPNRASGTNISGWSGSGRSGPSNVASSRGLGEHLSSRQRRQGDNSLQPDSRRADLHPSGSPLFRQSAVSDSSGPRRQDVYRDGVRREEMIRPTNFPSPQLQNAASGHLSSLFTGSSGTPCSSEFQSLPTRKVRQVEILRDRKLGNGAYGAVYLARCDNVLLCAAKVLHPILMSSWNGPKSPQNRFSLEREWMSSLRHPNIVQYLGTHTEPDESLALLMELMDESLTHLLDRCTLSFRTQVIIHHDISMALSYLHSYDIIHRDLSSNNVLLIGDCRAKLADFGMATMFGSCHESTTVCPGAEQYMPPEVINERDIVHTFKIDSFSHGVLLVQVATTRYPRPGSRTKASYTGGSRLIVSEVERRQQDLDEMTGHQLKDMALQCLSDTAENRPSSLEMCRWLERFRNSEESGSSVSHRRGRGDDESSSGGGGAHFRSYFGSDGEKFDDKSDKMKKKMAQLEDEMKKTRLELKGAKEKEAASIEEKELWKAKAESMSTHLRELNSVSQRAPSLSSNPSLSFSSVEEDIPVYNSLPVGFTSLPTEVPRFRSLSVSSSDHTSLDKAAVNLPCSMNFNVSVDEELSSNSVNLKATLKALADDSTISATVAPPDKVDVTKTFKCRVKYIPRIRGRHQLELSADEKKCVKDVFVGCSITQMIKVVRRMAIPKKIHHLVVRDDFIYCTFPECGEFGILNKATSDEIMVVKCNRKVRGIAWGPDDFLYVTGDHLVQKYSTDGWEATVTHGGDKSTQYCRPSGIGFFDQEVFVCDTGHSRLVVCDLGFDRVRTIPMQKKKNQPLNFQSPEDIAFDQTGRMFIADSGRRSVLICSVEGGFLEEIGCHPRGRPDLLCPKALLLSKEKLFVSDNRSHCVAVFDVNSKKRVHKIPMNEDPLGVAMDADGYVYVSCYKEKGDYIVVY